MPDRRPYMHRDSNSASPRLDGPQVLSFALEKRPKAKRASLPKVRTGCITCKKRHVKCDEAKPACDRCIRWRGHCGGYEERTTPAYSSDPDSDPGPRSLTPAGSGSESRYPSPPVDPLLLSTLHPSSDSHERPVSFHEWLRKADWESICEAPIEFNTRDGVFEADFWTDQLPSILSHNLQVLHANLAVHSIALSKRPSHSVIEQVFDGDSMRERAFKYYGRTLRMMGNVHGSVADVRNAIVCSLFCVIFEMQSKDYRAAESHFVGGQKMADELARVQGPGATRRGGSELYWELHNVLNFLKLQEGSANVDRWRQGFELCGRNWLDRDWTGEETWGVETPLMEFAVVPLTTQVEPAVNTTRYGLWQ